MIGPRSAKKISQKSGDSTLVSQDLQFDSLTKALDWLLYYYIN